MLRLSFYIEAIAMSTVTKRERGATFVEFALGFIVFFLLLSGSLELGFVLYHRSLLQTATKTAVEEVAKIRMSVDPASVDGLKAIDAALQRRVLEIVNARPIYGTTEESDIDWDRNLDECQSSGGSRPYLTLSTKWKDRCILCWTKLVPFGLTASATSPYEPGC